jgi:hypothetical protein
MARENAVSLWQPNDPKDSSFRFYNPKNHPDLHSHSELPQITVVGNHTAQSYPRLRVVETLDQVNFETTECIVLKIPRASDPQCVSNMVQQYMEGRDHILSARWLPDGTIQSGDVCLITSELFRNGLKGSVPGYYFDSDQDQLDLLKAYVRDGS